MLSLKGLPNVVDIRPIGLMCGIDLEPIAGKPGVRGYDAIERMYHEHDLYVRVTADTLVVAPPLIVSEAQIGEITDRISRVIKAVA
jgi:beta-alanine--pyruvate transaminase